MGAFVKKMKVILSQQASLSQGQFCNVSFAHNYLLYPSFRKELIICSLPSTWGILQNVSKVYRALRRQFGYSLTVLEHSGFRFQPQVFQINQHNPGRAVTKKRQAGL